MPIRKKRDLCGKNKRKNKIEARLEWLIFFHTNLDLFFLTSNFESSISSSLLKVSTGVSRTVFRFAKLVFKNIHINFVNCQCFCLARILKGMFFSLKAYVTVYSVSHGVLCTSFGQILAAGWRTFAKFEICNLLQALLN